MHLHSFRIKNFRRLKDVCIELEKDISIFVGANNSGKTSATHAIQLFMTTSKEKFTIHDFSADCWISLNTLGNLKEEEKEDDLLEAVKNFPTISLDLWFSVEESDLYRVIDLLPDLNWSDSFVGVRIELAPIDVEGLLNRYMEAKSKAFNNKQGEYHPWPKTLTEYLSDRLQQEFELRYYVLDRIHFDESFAQKGGYQPQQLTPDKGRSGAQIVKGILRVDCLDAQRHLSDSSGSRAEDLSRCLSRFYNRNLKKREEDFSVQKALSDARSDLNSHLEKVFAPTLTHLSNLGYPGLANPRLMIKSALSPSAIMSGQDGTSVHYFLEGSVAEEEYSLPDRYNGLGFKNLIYMVVELLDIHTQWTDTEEDRPLLHIIFIEEPEAHLHTQLQQVFIRKIFDTLKIDGDDANYYISQLVITTHSPHILYERGFQPIRYFRRGLTPGLQTSEVLNLSSFYKKEVEDREFLHRYMKLTHCDLFFADAAILVEGNVERLLMSLMIEKVAERLKSVCVTILEIGGAFGHRFKALIEFLGINTLIVTDIDSINPSTTLAKTDQSESDEDDDEDEEEGEENKSKKINGGACLATEPDAITSNQTLIQWLPRKTLISDLLSATEQERTQVLGNHGKAYVRVVYQTKHNVVWNLENDMLIGRTFEEAFALENITWTQNISRRTLKLRIPANSKKNLRELAERIYKRVQSKDFNKTDFALALMAEIPDQWNTPRYITDGLLWLSDLVVKEEIVHSIEETIEVHE